MGSVLQSAGQPSIPLLREKIGWLCQLIRRLIVAWLIWQLYSNLLPLISPAQSAGDWNRYWGLPPETVTVTKVVINRAIVFVSLGAAAVLGMAVWKLMSGYLAGDILSAEAARRLRLVGLTGLASAVIDIIVRPLMLGVLSSDILKQVRFIDWFEPRDLLYVLIALFVLALAYIQGTAAEISDEHRQFV
jgi:hypothetical protein